MGFTFPPTSTKIVNNATTTCTRSNNRWCLTLWFITTNVTSVVYMWVINIVKTSWWVDVNTTTIGNT